MSSEKPVEFVRGKSKRLRSLSTFSNVVEVGQKMKFPNTLKIRHDLLLDQQNVLNCIRLDSTKRTLEPTIAEIVKFVKRFPVGEIRTKFPFVPTICLSLNELFADCTEIMDLIKSNIDDESTTTFIHFENVNSVKDAIFLLYSHFAGRKFDSNFAGSLNDVIRLYETVGKTPVVIAFTDILTLDIRIFNDILHMLTTNFDRFPTVLIMPVTGGPFALNSLLNRDILQRLDVSTINIPNPVEFLDNFLLSLFSNDEFLKFDVTTYNVLNLEYRREFCSLKRYCDGLKLLLLEHFCNESYSAFSCSSKQLDQILKKVKSDFHEFAADFNRTPIKSPKKRVKSIVEHRLEADFRSNLFKYNDFSKTSFAVFQCFQYLLKRDPSTCTNSNTIFECFSNFFNPSYFHGDEFRTIMDSLDFDNIKLFLSESRQLFDNKNSVMSTELWNFFDEQLKLFETIDEYQRILDAKRQENYPSPKNGLKKQTRQDIQKQLLEKIRTKNEFDGFQIRKKQLFKELLDKFAIFTTGECGQKRIHDIENIKARRSYFVEHRNDVLSRFSNLSTRRSIKLALLNPFHSSKEDRKICFQLDCSIIFERYILCAPSICTRTLLKYFIDNLRNEQKLTGVKSRKRANAATITKQFEEQAIARFYKVIAEFEYLGLIKFAPRKKTVLSRLLFSI